LIISTRLARPPGREQARREVIEEDPTPRASALSGELLGELQDVARFVSAQ